MYRLSDEELKKSMEAIMDEFPELTDEVLNQFVDMERFNRAAERAAERASKQDEYSIWENVRIEPLEK